MRRALLDWAHAHGQSAPADALDREIASLRLQPAAEQALADLVHSHAEAQALQQEALAGLAPDEVDLLALHPNAVAAWREAHPRAPFAAFEAALAGLVARVDLGKNLAAASRLAQAVQDARAALRLPPADTAREQAATVLPAEPWVATEALVRLAFPEAAPGAPDLPRMPLPQALRLLVAADRADAGAVPPLPFPDILPPDVADALSAIVVAKAFSLHTRDPLAGGLALLNASRQSLPILTAFAARLENHVPPLRAVPADGPTGPTPDRDGDAWSDAAEDALGTDPADPRSRPVGGALATALGFPGGGPFLLEIGRPGEDPNGPALLLLGGTGPGTVDRPALVDIDLGGDDNYTVTVGTSRYFLLEAGGNDHYDTPDLDMTQGSAQGLGAAVLLDIAGNDHYAAGRRAQGSSCCGSGDDEGQPYGGGIAGSSGLADSALGAAGDAWGGHDNVTGEARKKTGGLGLLADLAGDDVYEARSQSQGYASNLFLSVRHEDLAPKDQVRGFAGILFDAGGADQYTFTTQGFARAAVPVVAGDQSGGARPVGLFVDGAGQDRYENRFVDDASLVPLDPEDGGAFFGTQGNALADPALAQNLVPSPVGAFLDIGGEDEYLLATLAAVYANATAAKNNNQRLPPVPVPDTSGKGQTVVPLPIFIDLEPTQAQGALLDRDGDGAPLVVEMLAGTDPDDPSDNPGSLFAPLPGLNGTYLARAPHALGSIPPVGGLLTLPGLAIAGRGDDVHAETFDLFIDLGGNDTYLGQGLGGARVPRAGLDGQRAPAVTLVLDLGGDDRYAPRASSYWFNATVDAPAYLSGASLGGAHLGVALLIDLEGTNSFAAEAEAHSRHDTLPGASTPVATAGAWGATQGAGMLGGVGVLMTEGSSNTFESEVAASAEDTDERSHAEAVAFALAQGAGYLGVGVLANFDSRDDSYRAEAAAEAADSAFGSFHQATGVAQGAAYGGVGLLLDTGGRNTFVAPQGFAQGTGWGVQDRTGSLPVLPVTSGGATGPLSDNDQTPTRIDTAFGVGLLFAGEGVDTFTAVGPAQGAAGAFLTTGQSWDTRDQRPMQFGLARGGAGLGALVDVGGDDEYTTDQASPRLRDGLGGSPAILAQGASLPGSVGALVDLSGNDRYMTGAGTLSQGATVAGFAVLVDLAGQDVYTADTRAQGFAQAAPVAAIRDHNCMFYYAYLPCSWSLGVATKNGLLGNQLLLDVMPQAATVGLLMDAEGLDRYASLEASQGYATDQVDPVLRAAFCRDLSPYNIVTNQSNLAQCPWPEPYRPTQNGLPGNPSNPEYIPSDHIGPDPRGPLVGALLDGDNTDAYVYPARPGKVPAAEATGPNDWQWRQEKLAARDLNQTGLPRNPVTGPLAPIQGVPPQPVLDQAWDAAKAYPPTMPGQPLPAPPTFGGGIDTGSLKAALDALAEEGIDLVHVSLQATLDEAGAQPLGQDAAKGLVYLQVIVSTPDPALVTGVDLVEESGGFASADAVAGEPGHYRYAWHLRQAGATPEVPGVMDGLHHVAAVARVRPDARLPGRSVESPFMPVEVDNPPLLSLSTDRTEVSGRLAPPLPEPLRLGVQVGADRAVPQGEAATGTPGGYLSVTLRSASAEVATLHGRSYVPAGSVQVTYAGLCGAGPCPDGDYQVVAKLEDAGGQVASSVAPLRIDSTPPHSQVLLPRYAGVQHKEGFSGLKVPWSVTDAGAPDQQGMSTDVLILSGATPASYTASYVAEGRGPAQMSVVQPGVDSGDTLRFVAVARDRLGNTESPCGAEEPSPCFRALVAADPARVAVTTVDFGPPTVEQVASTLEYIRPGVPVVFSAVASDPESGLSQVTIDMAGDPDTHVMTRTSEGKYEYDGWGNVDAALDSDERQVFATVTAQDLAANIATAAVSVVLDGRAPRLAALPTAYYSQIGGAGTVDETFRLGVGRHQAYALLRTEVEDASLQPGLTGASVLLDPSPLDPAMAPFPMVFDSATETWSALLPIPAATADGTYQLPVVATDAAGNEARSFLSLGCDDAVAPVGALHAIEIGFDHVTLAWTSEVAATTQLRYGRSPVDLGHSTPVDLIPRTDHIATAIGLAPSTAYSFRGYARGANGIEGNSTLLTLRTASAITLGLQGPQQGVTYSGVLPISVTSSVATGSGPIRITVAARSSNPALHPTPLFEVSDAGSTILDLRTLPDGLWSLRVDGSRAGDNATLFSPWFRVDNDAPFAVPLSPLPGEYTPWDPPTVEVAFGDPGGDPDFDWASVASLRIDGRSVQAVVTQSPGPITGANPLRLTPGAPFGEGRHILQAAAHDAAGHEVTVEWPITVDTRPPTSRGAYAEGPLGRASAPPGATVRIVANVDDASGLAFVQAGQEALGRPALALAEQAKGRWTAKVAIPADQPQGVLAFPIVARDRAGNQGPDVGFATVVVDSTHPSLQAVNVVPGLTNLTLRVHASEAVRADALLTLDPQHAATATDGRFSEEPVLELRGLRPGRDYLVPVHLVDAAGLESNTTVVARTAADQQPPGLPGDLRASSEDEGWVDLTWTPVLDDTGIQSYEAWDEVGSAWRAVADGNGTAAHVAYAPGRLVMVRLRAVDLGGLPGPEASTVVVVAARPHLEGLRTSTTIAKAGEAVRYEVTYRHGAGRPATVTLHVGGMAVPMVRESGDCRTGCVYAVSALLPTTTLFATVKWVNATAWDGEHTASTGPMRAPPVLDPSASGESNAAPAPSLAAILALLGIAWSQRRRRP
ncbi:MAG TPA: hypothetical protein VM286_01620 [Candidatus Thermoplasmatota archaeon]|nr:hypothetical protein [Candidatus Thermoplasmatota archaeon]